MTEEKKHLDQTGLISGRKVALIGGTETYKQAPYDDPSWEKWCLGNQFSQHVHHKESIHRIYEIHNDLEDQQILACKRKGEEPPADIAGWARGYAGALESYQIPLVVGEQFPVKADHIKVFDFDSAAKLLGGHYLTSTPAYMMADCCLAKLGMVEEPPVTDIALYGIDMSTDDTEYFYEQPVMKEWIGFAKGIGIRIHLPKGCPLGAPNYIEGVTANSNEGQAPFRVADFQQIRDIHAESIRGIDAEIAALTLKKAGHDGARQVYERLMTVARAHWGGQQVIMKNSVRVKP